MNISTYKDESDLKVRYKTEKLLLDKVKASLNEKLIIHIEGRHSEENIIYKESAPDEERGILSISETFYSMGIKYRRVLSTDPKIKDYLSIADFVFIYAHGEYGEDGRMQGWLDYIVVDYPGPGIFASSLCCDKLNFKCVIKGAGVKTPDFKEISPIDNLVSLYEKVSELGYRVMFKDRKCGSSIGITLVKNEEDLAQWLSDNSGKDINKYFIEKYIGDIFVIVDIIQISAGYYILSVLTAKTEAKFYDTETKIGTENHTVQFTLGGGFTTKIQKMLKDTAWSAFKSSACEGIGRVDIMIINDEAYVFEINTIPGISKNSNFTKMFTSFGFTYEELLLAVMNTAFLKNNYLLKCEESVEKTTIS